MMIRLFDRLLNAFSGMTAPDPPPLALSYTRADYSAFMKAELMQLTPLYARKRVRVSGRHHLYQGLRTGSVMLGMLHHGSWLLIGGVIRHRLHLPFNVIASRRNFDVMSNADLTYWSQAHQHLTDYYGTEPFYSDQSSYRVLSWLKGFRNVLGVALDVREYNQKHQEEPLEFLNETIWIQTAPARLARLAGVKIIPTLINYEPALGRHELRFYPAIDPERQQSDAQTTQAVLATLQSDYARYQKQAFFDLCQVFSTPHCPQE